MGGEGSQTESQNTNYTDPSGNKIIAPNPANFDSGDIATFSTSEHAKSLGYTQDQIKSLLGSAYQGPSGSYSFGQNGAYTDISNLANIFSSWKSGNQQTQTNWQNYANAANANQGGEGDQTITSGAAQSQRQILLGALANPNNTTSPAAALGSMGVARKNGKPVIPGAAK